MKLLAAAKLVDLSEDEAAEYEAAPQGEAVPEHAAMDQASNPASDYGSTPPPLPPDAGLQSLPLSSVVEGKTFDSIFAEAGVPASPYPAERLLRLIDGLRAMDANTRHTAVRAMDAADDSWTIEDPVLDAQRKIGVLESYRQALAGQVASNEELAVAEVAELKAAEEKAVAEIRKQIAGLEKLLEREMHKTAETIATRQAGMSAERAAADRETQRVNTEIDRLREIAVQFAGTHTHS